MKYKLQMLDKDPIRQPVELGIKLKDIVPPVDPGTPGSPGCCSVCDGWGVLIDGVPTLGDFMEIPNAETTIEINLLGSLCPGECIEWTLLLIRGDQAQLDDFTMSTASGCDGVTIVGAWTLNHSGLMFGVYPTINGKPFCKPVLLISNEACTPTQSVTGWYSLLDDPLGPPNPQPQQPIEAGTTGAVLNPTTFPNRAFFMDISPHVYGDWFTDNCSANIVAVFFIINGGDPGAYGDFFLLPPTGADVVMRWGATGANDYTDIEVILEMQLTSPFPNLPVTPQITLNCTGSP